MSAVELHFCLFVVMCRLSCLSLRPCGPHPGRDAFDRLLCRSYVVGPGVDIQNPGDRCIVIVFSCFSSSIVQVHKELCLVILTAVCADSGCGTVAAQQISGSMDSL